MKKFSFVLLIAFVASIGLYAAPLTVSWADGKVDLKKGSAWAAVSVGDKVDSSSTIRLGKDSTVELSDGQRKVSITAEGSYLLDSLLKKGAVATKKSTAAMDKLGKLVDPQASVSTTSVAAVRGAAVEPSSESVEWQSDTADLGTLMEEGRRLVRNGDYAGAARRFNEAVGIAEGVDKDEALYSEAWALAADDSQARAVNILRGMPASGNWAGPKALLLARLDIDSDNKAEAKTLLQSGLSGKIFVGDEVDLAKSLLEEASAE
jgi:hypothetical protein